MTGTDPAGLGLQPAFTPATVRRLLVQEPIPTALGAPLAEYLDQVPGDVERPRGLGADVHHEHHGHDAGGHEHHGHDTGAHEHHGHDAGGHGHGGHDHHDMMAIVGEPSDDGLVMEPIELEFGPLATSLPGGLVASIRLDGDVVASCDLEPLLTAGDETAPDPLAPKVWEIALASAREAAAGVVAPPPERWRRIAALEVERALSHVTWLRAFARLLGWQTLVERSSRAIAAILDAQGLAPPALGQARRETASLLGSVDASRRLRWRAAGRAQISAEHARELGLRGPAARASGVADDTRMTDPLYTRLGFEPVVREEGDAMARTRVRMREATAALELAAKALDADAELADALPEPTHLAVVEGPRGPLCAWLDGAQLQHSAPGEAAALKAAETSAVGSEWAAAVLAMASFDLSPWRSAA